MTGGDAEREAERRQAEIEAMDEYQRHGLFWGEQDRIVRHARSLIERYDLDPEIAERIEQGFAESPLKDPEGEASTDALEAVAELLEGINEAKRREAGDEGQQG